MIFVIFKNKPPWKGLFTEQTEDYKRERERQLAEARAGVIDSFSMGTGWGIEEKRTYGKYRTEKCGNYDN